MYRKKRLLKRRGKRTSRRGGGVKKLVKRMISRSIETKSRQFNAANGLCQYGNALFASTNIIPVSPYGLYLDIQQGTGAGGRIGNRIQLMSLKMKCTIYPRAYDAATNTQPTPQNVRILVFKAKFQKNSLATAGTLGNMFQDNNSATSPTGTLFDCFRTINKDDFIIYMDKQIKIGCANNNGTGNQAGSQYYSNNDFKFNKTFTLNFSKFMPKTVTYNDTYTFPTSDVLQVVFFPCNCDGQGFGNIPLYMLYQLDCKYKDA